MNILYISNHLNIGGITSYLLNLSVAMKKRGHNVFIASSGGRLLSRFIDEGIIYINIPIRTKQEVSPGILLSMLKLGSQIKKHRIELLHSNSRTTQVLGCLLNKFYKTRHISTCHGFFKKRLSRQLFPCWGEKVIAISEAVRGHLVNDFGVQDNKITIVHSGIDCSHLSTPSSQLKTQIRKKLGLGEGPVIGIIARLSEEKGHSYLIQAMRKVIDKSPTAQLLIVGDGRMKGELVKLSKELGLENNVFFAPSFENTLEPLICLDIFVLASLKEGLGLALMEAMAAGLCVVGTRVGGIKSLIRDGTNGCLVKPADAGQLSDVISTLINDEKRRKFLGDNARNFIRENFSLEKMVRGTEEVYLECLGANH